MKTELSTLAFLLVLAHPAARSQDLRFSMQGGGASSGMVGSDGTVLRGGAVLIPDLAPPKLGPLKPPATLYADVDIGLMTTGQRDIDAMSHGRDAYPDPGIDLGQLWFSVDDLSQALGGASWANVANELPESDVDTFVNLLAVPSVPADGSVIGEHAAILDGNGMAHPITFNKRAGLGLVELGDSLDGIDHVAGSPPGVDDQLFFSLTPAAAAAHGYQPGDVLVSNLAGAFFPHAPAMQLGLDLAGPGTDDIDALAVWDDPGTPGYQPPGQNGGNPYAWGPGMGGGDMILFSVTRDSAVVGQPDSHFGIPIQPGDILTSPEPFGMNMNPAIVVAAERIFLRADRTGGNVDMDDLDALDLVDQPLFDCNGNGLEDATDIALGMDTDLDRNGIPDGCDGQHLRFSMEGGGPSAGVTGFDGSTLRGGAVLIPEIDPPALGPLNPPGTMHGSTTIGLNPVGTRDIDAISHGRDVRPELGIGAGQLWFSVDDLSTGLGGVSWANVDNELPEASADAFTNVQPMVSIPADNTVTAEHVALIDGNGLAHPITGQTRGGLGLIEVGDALDGIDEVAIGDSDGQLFFSLTQPAALAHGVLPGEVLLSDLMGGFGVYASSTSLGLDLMGLGTDDIDALAVWDDPGLFSTGFTPPVNAPYAWGPGKGDMVLFSVTRDSAVVGQPDSHFGIPIQPGDVLTVPEPSSPFSAYPAIVVAAERIHLRADRSGANVDMDDLDSLDIAPGLLFDCNGNGVEDAVDIATGMEADLNKNGTPDSCESLVSVSYCTAGTSASGCQATLSSVGTASASALSGFTVLAANVEALKSGQYYFGVNGRKATPWGTSSSFQCVNPPVTRCGLLPAIGTLGACDGAFAQDLNALWCPSCPKPLKNPGAGVLVQLQLWYRDPASTSSSTTALSDALEFPVVP